MIVYDFTVKEDSQDQTMGDDNQLLQEQLERQMYLAKDPKGTSFLMRIFCNQLRSEVKWQSCYYRVATAIRMINPFFLQNVL